jgi:alpha-1,3-rhamnosyl/mannosyltransferase
MRVALDIRACFGTATGIGQYTVELARALSDLGVEVTLWFTAWDDSAHERLAPEVLALDGRVRLQRTRVPNSLLYRGSALRFWSHWPRWAPVPELLPTDIDLYHAVYWPLPLTRRVPMILTVHDLVALENPDRFDEVERQIHQSICRLAPRAAHVITDSEATRQVVLEFTRVAPERVTTIPLGVGAPFTEPVSADDVARVRDTYGLDRPFILCVGTLEPRKNQERLIDAYDLLCQDHGPHWDLILVGGKGRGGDEIAPRLRYPRPGQVRHLGYLPRADIAPLYAAAQAFALVSLAEGFGLPALEAMAVGCPVVASNLSSLPEVVGDAARLVNPFDIEEIAQALAEVLLNPALAQHLGALGRARASMFTWETTARRTLEIYRTVLHQ